MMIVSFAELHSKEESLVVYFVSPPGYNKSDVEASVLYWVNEISRDYSSKVNTNCRIYDDFSEILKSKDNHKNRLYVTSTIEYLKMKEEVNILPEAIININICKGDEGERFIILSDKKSKFKSITDLKDAKISISSDYSGTSIQYYWLNNLFNKQFGTSFDKYSKNISVAKEYKQALMDVFFGKSDVCIINKFTYYTMIKLNPQIDKTLQVIVESEDFAPKVIYLSDTFDQKLKSFILSRLLKLNKYDTGKQIKDVFRYDNIVLFEESLINSAKKLYNESIKNNKN